MNKTYKQLEKLYDGLYAEAEAIIKAHNPCEVKIRNGHAQCLACHVRPQSIRQDELCCDGCQFHSTKGCIAEKPLTCKLWLCGSAEDKYPEVDARLDKLRQIASANRLYVYRGDKAMTMKNAMGYFQRNRFMPTLLTLKKMFV